MNDFFFWSIIILALLMFLLLYRIIMGPTVIDRIVAVNVIGTKSIVILVMIGIVFERVGMFVDIAIGYGLLNFIASLAAAKYFKKHVRLKLNKDNNNQESESQVSYVN